MLISWVTSSLIDWRGEHFVVAPPLQCSLLQGQITHAKHARPFSKTQGSSVVRNKSIVRFVLRLFFRRGPAAICGPAILKALGAFAATIMAIWIFPVKRSPERTFAHVGNEREARVAPALAHLYAARAVYCVAFIFLVIASAFGAGIRSRSWRVARILLARVANWRYNLRRFINHIYGMVLSLETRDPARDSAPRFILPRTYTISTLFLCLLCIN